MRGDTCVLPLSKARILSASGKVEIVDKEKLKTRVIEDTDYLFSNGFSKRKLTRVAWVQNYNKHGGAEISNFNMVRIGKKLGYDIVGCALGDPRFSYEVLKRADVVIVNNLHNGNKGEFITWLLKSGKPFVKYDHDHMENVKEVYTKSDLNVFISPQHQAHYVKMCGDEILERSMCLPLAFDVDVWQPSDMQRAGTVLIPCWRKSRLNAQDFIHKNPEYFYTTIGDMVPFGLRMTTIPDVPYSQMHEVYPLYEQVLHVPDSVGAGERVVFEAVLSGCSVICNENVGHASWDFDWRDPIVLRPILRQAPYQFWSAVERVLK
jgi:hypothetical protein